MFILLPVYDSETFGIDQYMTFLYKREVYVLTNINGDTYYQGLTFIRFTSNSHLTYLINHRLKMLLYC